MTEILNPTNPEALEPHNEAIDTRRRGLAPLIGKEALLADSIKAFYGAADAYLGRSVGGGEIRSIIQKHDGSNEVIAHGTEVGGTLRGTLDAMHSLEKAVTKPIMHVKIDGMTVSFTELKHYSPRIAPTREAYVVPNHLESVLKNTGGGMRTYEKTISQEGWVTTLFDQVATFLDTDVTGKALMRGLDITSLTSLTPEQAVKLSLGIVQSVSKYSWIQEEGTYKPGGKREDDMTTMELLAEGIDHRNEAGWAGNGVCRNVASNVKALFESMKANQSELSMLHNTYSTYTAAYMGETYGARGREDDSKQRFRKDPNGHAWNTFVTVDKAGDSSITIVDATWAMGSNADGSLKQPDYTMQRMFESASTLAEQADDKAHAAWAMSDYLDKFTRARPGETAEAREQKQQFALTEWLKLVPVMLNADVVAVPSGVIGAAYRLGAKLDKSELQILFEIEQAGWIDNFDAILGRYVNGKTHQGGPHRLTVSDDVLQTKIIQKLSKETFQDYADRDVDFRIRVRETVPSVLPDFDPAKNVADKAELSSLAREAGVFITGDKYYGDVVRTGLLKAAEGREDVVINLTTDISDYDILRHYRDIRSAAAKS